MIDRVRLIDWLIDCQMIWRGAEDIDPGGHDDDVMVVVTKIIWLTCLLLMSSACARCDGMVVST